MLEFLKVNNIALIDGIEIEFGPGLNLLTGETGSGKSIIVDSLAMLTGERARTELIKSGEASARVEGIFSVAVDGELRAALDAAGVEIDDAEVSEIIVRRELSAAGKNRAFVNGGLVTQNILKDLGPHLVAIHGQGEQMSLFDASSHLELLDRFAGVRKEREKVATAYANWRAAHDELEALRTNDAETLRLLDVLRFQIDEIRAAALEPGEEDRLGEEKLKLSNVEKIAALSSDAHALLYEDDASTAATFEKAARKIEELAEFDHSFADYLESIRTTSALIDDLAIATRDLKSHLDFSPERLDEIEQRLSEISRVTRKYGGTVDTALEHLQTNEAKLDSIELSELREKELKAELATARDSYLEAAASLSKKRSAAAPKFEKNVVADLKAVAIEKARFVVSVTPRPGDADGDNFSAKGSDRVEFMFSANPGEEPKPLAKIASGGEASRLMLVLKTAAGGERTAATAIFDEVDSGIGGRVAEAVGQKLKLLSASQQVICVTHQPQVAAKADRHFVVEKFSQKNSTTIEVRELDDAEKVEEIARMLAGEKITDAARENAREMIASA